MRTKSPGAEGLIPRWVCAIRMTVPSTRVQVRGLSVLYEASRVAVDCSSGGQVCTKLTQLRSHRSPTPTRHQGMPLLSQPRRSVPRSSLPVAPNGLARLQHPQQAISQARRRIASPSTPATVGTEYNHTNSEYAPRSACRSPVGTTPRQAHQENFRVTAEE